MISFTLQKNKTAFGTKRALVIAGALFLVLLAGSVLPLQVHAATATTTPTAAPATGQVSILPSNLTTSNGWTCTSQLSSSYSCTSSNTALAGDTVNCLNSDADLSSGQLSQATCQLTNAAGTDLADSGTNNGMFQYGESSTSNTPAVAAQDTTTNNAAGAAVAGVGDCISGGIGGIANCIISAVAYLIFQLAATILGYVGLLFNWVVTVTVFGFGTYFANSPGMLVAWGILRDIGNIVILFGFILMGIMMILDLEGYNVRKALPRLLIFAVLLNFSLFASEAVVDVSNALASAFFGAAGGPSVSGLNCVGTLGLPNSACSNVGIAGDIITATGMSTLWSPGSINANSGASALASIAKPDGAIMLILLALFVSIAAIVLLAGAIMFFIRAITLAFLLIISPLGFAGMAIPQFQKAANGWWKKLISESFFAPVFLLLIFVALKITSIIQVQGGTNGTFFSAIQPGQVNMGLIFLFFMVFGFMVAAIVMAKSIGATGADFAISTSTKFMGAATLGTTGFVGRRLIGGSSSALAQGVRNSPLGKTELGRGIAGVFDKGASASYDARSLKAVKGLAKNKMLPLDLGQPSKTAKGGFHEIEKQATKARTDYAETLKMSDAQTKATAQLKDDKKKSDTDWKARKKALSDENSEIQKKSKEEAAELEKFTTQKAAAQKEINDALVSGDAVKRDAALATKKDLDDKIKTINESLATGTNKIRANNAALESEGKKYVEDTAKIEAGIVKNNPALQYAHNIEHDFLGNLIPIVSVGKHANHAAVKTIQKTANMNDFQKGIESINKELKKQGVELHEEHEEQQEAAATQTNTAPTNTPPASGGDGHGH